MTLQSLFQKPKRNRRAMEVGYPSHRMSLRLMMCTNWLCQAPITWIEFDEHVHMGRHGHEHTNRHGIKNLEVKPSPYCSTRHFQS